LIAASSQPKNTMSDPALTAFKVNNDVYASRENLTSGMSSRPRVISQATSDRVVIASISNGSRHVNSIAASIRQGKKSNRTPAASPSIIEQKTTFATERITIAIAVIAKKKDPRKRVRDAHPGVTADNPPQVNRIVMHGQHHRKTEQGGGKGLDLQEQKEADLEPSTPLLTQRSVTGILGTAGRALRDVQAKSH
jgi:hypothetical protein